MGALVCGWMRVDPADRPDFVAFHTLEHMPERLGVPGFRRGRRFRSRSRPDQYLVVYEVEALGILTSAAYLERLNNPTPWTQSWMPKLSGGRRAGVDLIHVSGPARGGVIAVFHLPSGLADAAASTAVLAACDGVVAVQAGRVDDPSSNLDTAERRALGGAEAGGVLVLVEAVDEAMLTAALASPAAAFLGASLADAEIYRLEICLD